LVGNFDAAVVDNENGKPHIVKRMDRPRIRVIPEELGFAQHLRKELKEAASELSGNQAALIMVGEPTVDKAFDKAVTRAAKTVKQNVDMTTDQLAQELKNAVGS
jgi:molybdenum cofactor biosynthesis enzyme MoaA